MDGLCIRKVPVLSGRERDKVAPLDHVLVLHSLLPRVLPDMLASRRVLDLEEVLDRVLLLVVLAPASAVGQAPPVDLPDGHAVLFFARLQPAVRPGAVVKIDLEGEEIEAARRDLVHDDADARADHPRRGFEADVGEGHILAPADAEEARGERGHDLPPLKTGAVVLLPEIDGGTILDGAQIDPVPGHFAGGADGEVVRLACVGDFFEEPPLETGAVVLLPDVELLAVLRDTQEHCSSLDAAADGEGEHTLLPAHLVDAPLLAARVVVLVPEIDGRRFLVHAQEASIGGKPIQNFQLSVAPSQHRFSPRPARSLSKIKKSSETLLWSSYPGNGRSRAGARCGRCRPVAARKRPASLAVRRSDGPSQGLELGLNRPAGPAQRSGRQGGRAREEREITREELLLAAVVEDRDKGHRLGRGRLLSLATEKERSLFFDLLPIERASLFHLAFDSRSRCAVAISCSSSSAARLALAPVAPPLLCLSLLASSCAHGTLAARTARPRRECTRVAVDLLSSLGASVFWVSHPTTAKRLYPNRLLLRPGLTP